MNTILLIFSAGLIIGASAQYEAGFVKILEDQRYQDGSAFGNYRNQEDGIKYKEEVDLNGRRTGFWEYPEEGTGRTVRVEFEAGPGIGFRIINSNIVLPTPVAQKTPSVNPVPKPQIPAFQVPKQPVHPHHSFVPQQPIIPTIPRTTPAPALNLFDYPAELQFSRSTDGHRFKFSAV